MGNIFGYGLGTLILAAAIIYGILASRRRNRANDPVTDEATRKLYDDEDRYASSDERDMRRKIEPS